MKKFKFAALIVCFAAIGLMFSSCSKSEDLILGVWKVVRITNGGQTVVYSDSDNYTYEFKADNTVTMSYRGTPSGTLTYSIEGNALYIDNNKSIIETLTKKKMILSDPDDSNNTIEFEKL
ncbi:MAG: lipocalin family protein [Bacteroidales bacterium]|nr:lipocalin family protein [Bacteroidales bacterium]